MESSGLEARKLELIRWLAVVEDTAVLDEVAHLKERSTRDWWDEISDAEKTSISKGIEDADAGKLKPHSEARAIYEEWL